MSGSCYNWNAAKGKPELADSRYDQPCPQGGGCCAPGDTCVGTFMCKHKEPPATPNRPIYYISACTDSKYSASACSKFCAKWVRTGVVYNDTTAEWACCGTPGNGNLTTLCATPTDQTFSLVPPEDLVVNGIAGAGLTPSESSSIATSAPTSTSDPSMTSQFLSPTPSASPPDETGMNTGIQVGLGVGLGLGLGIALIAVAAIFFVRRRRRMRNMEAMPAMDEQSTGPGSYFTPIKHDVPSPHLGYTSTPPGKQDSMTKTRLHELGDPGVSPSELPLHHQSRAELP